MLSLSRADEQMETLGILSFPTRPRHRCLPFPADWSKVVETMINIFIVLFLLPTPSLTSTPTTLLLPPLFRSILGLLSHPSLFGFYSGVLLLLLSFPVPVFSSLSLLSCCCYCLLLLLLKKKKSMYFSLSS